MGGNIIGVGSKIKKPSLRIYLGGDTYQQWEFIWNPTGQTGGAWANACESERESHGRSKRSTNAKRSQSHGILQDSPDGQQPQQVRQRQSSMRRSALLSKRHVAPAFRRASVAQKMLA